jgi:hypothetical protein
MGDVTRFKVAEVPEGLSDKSAKAYVSKGITEGRLRERADQEALAKETAIRHAGAIEGMKQAQEAELSRSAKIVSRAAHRDGMLQGLVAGMLCAIGLAFATWAVMKQVVVFNTATQRVNYPNPPTLQVPESNLEYERAAREPGDAP